MSSKILEYQDLEKKLRNIKKENQNADDEKALQALNATIKDAQAKILALEETSKSLLATLDKLMGVQKKGLAYVEKCKKTNLDSMSIDDLKDFETKAQQTLKQLSELETRISQHKAEVKNVVLDYKMYRKQILDAKEKREALKDKSAQQLQQIQPKIDAIKAEMAELEKEIEAPVLAKYKSLKQDGIFPVVVPLVERRCGGCRMELSSVALDKLKTGGVYECEQCRRLIYLDKE